MFNTSKPMVKFKIDLDQVENHKVTRSPILFVSLNPITEILGYCTGDSGIVFMHLPGLDKSNQTTRSKSVVSTPTENTSVVDIGIQHVTKFIWLNNYQFAAAGSGGSIKIFSFMNLREESFELHQSGISALKISEHLLVTGSSDGKVVLWDSRSKSLSLEIPHSVKSKMQPIKDCLLENNMVYSSTVFNGRIWSWDIRSPKKPLNIVENRRIQNCLHFHDGCIYSSSDEGIRRYSATLQIFEQICDKPVKNILGFSRRFKSLIFTGVDSVLMHSDKKIREFDVPGISGLEFYGDDGIISYGSDGNVKIFKLFKSVYV